MTKKISSNGFVQHEDRDESRSYTPGGFTSPGEALRIWLESSGTAEETLADLTKIDLAYLRELLADAQPFTQEVASRIEVATRTPAWVWMRLSKTYQEQQRRERDAASLDLLTSPSNE